MVRAFIVFGGVTHYEDIWAHVPRVQRFKIVTPLLGDECTGMQDGEEAGIDWIVDDGV